MKSATHFLMCAILVSFVFGFFQPATADDSEAAKRLTDQGFDFLRNGKLDTAILRFGSAIQLDKSNGLAYYGLGRAWGEKGEIDKAISALDDSARCLPNLAMTFRDRGKLWVMKGDPDRAIKDCNRAIILDPTDATNLLWRGEAYSKKVFQNRAILHSALIAPLSNSTIVIDNLQRGTVIAVCCSFAFNDFNEALQLNRQLAPAMQLRGCLSMSLGRFSHAISDFSCCLIIDSNNIDYRHCRGHCRFMVGQYDAALEDFEIVLKQNSKHIPSRHDRVLIYLSRQEWKNALSELNEVIRINAEDEFALLNRAWLLRMNRQWEAAMTDLDRLLILRPNNVRGRFERALILATCPKDSIRDGFRAYKDANLACELTGWQDPGTLAVLAMTLAESGDFVQAIKWQRIALQNADYAKRDGEWANILIRDYENGKPLRLSSGLSFEK